MKATSKSAQELDLSVSSRSTERHFLEEPGSSWLFFPEGFIAAALVLAAPVWAIILMSEGQFLRALVLIAGVGTFGFAAFDCLRKNEKWSTYAAIVGIVLIGFFVGSWTQ